MSAFENRDYADGYRDGTRFAEVTITSLRTENEKLRAALEQIAGYRMKGKSDADIARAALEGK